jgi:hypothetical protein
MTSNIMKLIFIIGEHIPHKIDLIGNKYINKIPSLDVVIHY